MTPSPQILDNEHGIKLINEQFTSYFVNEIGLDGGTFLQPGKGRDMKNFSISDFIKNLLEVDLETITDKQKLALTIVGIIRAKHFAKTKEQYKSLIDLLRRIPEIDTNLFLFASIAALYIDRVQENDFHRKEENFTRDEILEIIPQNISIPVQQAIEAYQLNRTNVESMYELKTNLIYFIRSLYPDGSLSYGKILKELGTYRDLWQYVGNSSSIYNVTLNKPILYRRILLNAFEKDTNFEDIFAWIIESIKEFELYDDLIADIIGFVGGMIDDFEKNGNLSQERALGLAKGLCNIGNVENLTLNSQAQMYITNAIIYLKTSKNIDLSVLNDDLTKLAKKQNNDLILRHFRTNGILLESLR